MPGCVRLARPLEVDGHHPAEGCGRRAGELPAHRAALELGGVDVHVVRRRLGQHRRDDSPRGRCTAARLAVRTRGREGYDDGPGHSARSAVDVSRHGGREVLDRELVADLPLPGAQPDRGGARADRIAGRGLRLARQGDVEHTSAGRRGHHGLRAGAERRADDVRCVLQVSAQLARRDGELHVRLRRRGCPVTDHPGRGVRSRVCGRERPARESHDQEQQSEAFHLSLPPVGCLRLRRRRDTGLPDSATAVLDRPEAA